MTRRDARAEAQDHIEINQTDRVIRSFQSGEPLADWLDGRAPHGWWIAPALVVSLVVWGLMAWALIAWGLA
ncbi:hypothetical protein JF540_22730 [Salipiger thiooxidans]|uniref:hypothetical protein n=1 Tax=Salipiger thiooxidans TaxID=282683 RepID=UPI001A8FEC18|nr:hypothetical protein [Salipiger thiooxidans]MBN8189505.1 hypothetical protein [Salipiger thiooxidans]